MDGYWVYSDAFDIPNLRIGSGQTIRRLLRRPRSIASTQGSVLLWYTIGSIAFFGWASWLLAISVGHAFATQPAALLANLLDGRPMAVAPSAFALFVSAYAVYIVAAKVLRLLKSFL